MLYGQIEYFLEMEVMTNIYYTLAKVNLLVWNGNKDLHLLTTLNRLIAQPETDDEQVCWVPLHHLKEHHQRSLQGKVLERLDVLVQKIRNKYCENISIF